MSDYDNFWTDGDKPYAEHLNDALALVDAFDLTVPLSMPGMFSNGEFSSGVNVPRKCGVGIVTLKSVASGVTVGTSSISGSGEVVFRVYPNFNCFYKWSRIVLSKTGTVNVAFRKVDGTSISASVDSEGVISDNSALKQLMEVDVVLTLSGASISNILIEFVNDQSRGRVRTGALLEASQLANVNGTVTANNDKAVNGGTVYNALNSVETSLSEDISDLSDVVDNLSDSTSSNLALKEDKSNKVTSLDSSDTHYPTSNAVKSVTDTKENLSNKVTTLDNSNSHYPSTSAVLPLLTWINTIINDISDVSFAPHFTVSNKVLNVGDSVVSSNISNLLVVLKISGNGISYGPTTKTLTSKTSTLNNLGYITEWSYTNFSTINIKIINPLNNQVLLDKTYDKDGNVVS